MRSVEEVLTDLREKTMIEEFVQKENLTIVKLFANDYVHNIADILILMQYRGQSLLSSYNTQNYARHGIEHFVNLVFKRSV